MSNSFLSNLLPNEKIIYKTNPHWLFIVIPVLGIFLFWLVYLFFICSFIGAVLLSELANFCIYFWSKICYTHKKTKTRQSIHVRKKNHTL